MRRLKRDEDKSSLHFITSSTAAQLKVKTRSSRQLVLYPTDPWLRSRPPTRRCLIQGAISVQPRGALATANPCYRRGFAVASGRAHRGALWELSQSVLVARWSVVRDLNPGRRRSTGGQLSLIHISEPTRPY